MPGHLFLSYVRENTAQIQRLVADLEARGLSVWLDRSRLVAGERWRDAIRKAIRSGDLFLACFSRAYANRDRTQMNEELNIAIDELRLRPADRAWFIPVVLDGGDVPDRAISTHESLRDFHWVDLDDNWVAGVDMIVKAALRAVEQGPGEPDAPMSSAGVRPTDHQNLQQPALTITADLQRGSSYWRNVTHQEIRILLTVWNEGPGTVEAPYIRLQVPQPFAISPRGVTSHEPGAPLHLVREAVQPPAVSLIGRADFVIYDGTSIQIAELVTTIKGSAPVPHCDIQFRIASRGSAAREMNLHIPPEEIASFLERTVEPEERE